MTRLKIIGGPSDGKIVEVDDKTHVIDVWDPVTRQLVVNPNGEMIGPTMTRTCYMRRWLRWRREKDLYDEVSFLAPHDWTDARAVEHQFEK